MKESLLSKVYTESEKTFSRIISQQGKILSEFFRNQVLTYEEPRAKRVPRGASKGFPRKKKWAVFLTTVGKSPKQISDVLDTMGVRHGTAKNWSVEPAFKKMVLQGQEEITECFVNKLVELSETTETVLLDGNKPAVEKIFGKAEYYGPELSQQIAQAIIERLNEDKSLALLHTAAEVLSIFYEGFESDPIEKQTEQDLEDYFSIHVLCRMLHVVKENPAVLHRSPEKAKWLSDMFARSISLWAIETNLPMDLIDRLIDTDDWITDDLKFVGRVGLLWDGKEKSKEWTAIKRKILLKQQAQSIIQGEIEDLKKELFLPKREQNKS